MSALPGTLLLRSGCFAILLFMLFQAYTSFGELNDTSSQLINQWKSLLSDPKHSSDLEKLASANNFFNDNIRFTTDMAAWNVKDYWATPLETLKLRQGDCEDFSIAKYITLLKMNVSVDKLRLVYVKAILPTGQTQAHMVLAYYPSLHAEPFILDNLNLNILPASKRRDLIPIYSFNSEGLWIGQDRNPKIKRAETRLSNWREVMLRMKTEGIYD
ncbi:hypothetical protein TDB9533_04558 [Thalassocella blandensis]|nr:hypothetical protein TDB9533_04558 [Thalassocella blandensis]